MKGGYVSNFVKIIESNSWLMDILSNIKDLELKDWIIGGGAVRNTIWDYLHGYKENTPLKDIDLTFYDASNLSTKREKEIQNKLQEIYPRLKWDVVNAARVHLWNKKYTKLNSSAEVLQYWSETANCVGISLDDQGSIIIHAPYGIEDLMELIVKPIPYYANKELYESRIKVKAWKTKWPKLQIAPFKS